MSAILERRIAAALKSDEIASADLADLIEETEAAATAADAAAEAEHAKALDLLASPDAAKARAAMERAAFTRDRLRTVLPRLQQRLLEVQEQEYAARWRIGYAEVETKRDALAAELREMYPPIVARITDLFTRIRACDHEVSRVNGSAPSGEPLRLREVELAARDLEHFTRAEPSIARELKLPHWDEPSRLAWPPPRQFNPAMFAPLPFDRRFTVDWASEREERTGRPAGGARARSGPLRGHGSAT